MESMSEALKEFTKQCNIFGVDDTAEPDPTVKIALQSSTLLNIFKFIEITKFELL